MTEKIALSCGSREFGCKAQVTFHRDWRAKQLPYVAPMGPDPRHVDPVCRLNVDQSNFHGSLEESLYVIPDNGDEPAAFLLWTALSGEQERDGFARLVLVGVVPVDQIDAVEIGEDLDPGQRRLAVATVVLTAAYLRRRLDDGEDEICAETEEGEAWPNGLVSWDAFVEAVLTEDPIRLNVVEEL